MVRKLSISPEDSDLSLPTGEEEREVKEADPLSSSFPTWSSRVKCLEAYICVLLSFTCSLEQCKIIGMYGSVVFVVYFVYTIVIGVPIVFLEVLLGRYVMGNVIKAWSMCPFGKGLLACLFLTTTYAIVMNNINSAYLIKYLFSFHRGHIPWDKCRKPWAKENCFVIAKNGSALIDCIHVHSASYCHNLSWESSGTQYWKYVVGNTTDTTEICFTAAYSLLSIILVVLINLKGHRSCEKVFIVLVYFPILLSIILTITAYSSLAALKGLLSFLKFDWSLIFRFKMWTVVFENFIVSLGVGTLALSFVSSHGKFNDNIFVDALVVVLTIIISPSFVAIPISSVFVATEILYDGSPLADFFCKLINAEDSMINNFIKMSEALLVFPYPNAFWSFLFYLQMVLMSIGTQALLTLALCEAVGGIFSQNNFLGNSVTIAVISFALGAPYFFFTFDFEYRLHTVIVTVIILYAVTLQIFYGYKKFNDDYHFMLGYPPSLLFLRIFWISIIPIFLFQVGFKIYYSSFNKTSNKEIYIHIAIPLIVYFLVAVVQIIRAARKGNVSSAFVAYPDWGPDNSLLKMSRVIFNTRTITKEFMYRQELYRKPLMKPPDFSDQNIVQIL